jgi:hypothetical protein
VFSRAEPFIGFLVWLTSPIAQFAAPAILPHSFTTVSIASLSFSLTL